MRFSTLTWQLVDGWQEHGIRPERIDLVLFFAAPETLEVMDAYSALQTRFSAAHVVGCTTGGEIFKEQVSDGGLVAVAIQFEHTTVRVFARELKFAQDSEIVGRELADALRGEQLKAVLLLADGMSTNGAALVEGLREVLPDSVTITGGLAADGARFQTTQTAGDGTSQQHQVVAVGLYGDAIQVGWGSVGGWQPHGDVHRITRATQDVLYEIDGKPALQVYKDYLGERAADLPGAGLLYPLAVWNGDDEAHYTVRTIIGINESANSLIFAGTMPEGAHVRLMQAGLPDLIAGAQQAGQHAQQHESNSGIAILVSCIGRKLLMAHRSADEVKAVAHALGGGFLPIGFYSYGEIAPNAITGSCELHNQTMTVTTLSERV